MPPKAAPAHPKYDVMIKAAILSLKDRSGSSVPAICKYLAANYKLNEKTFKKATANALKKLTAEGKLVKVKASYKLSESFKKPASIPKKKAAPKKAAAPKKKAAPKKAAAPKKKVAPKKAAAPKKKVAPKKTAAPKKKAAPKNTAPKKKSVPKKA